MRRGLFAALILLWAGSALSQSLALSLDAIRHPAFEADGVAAHVDLARTGEAELRVARLRLGEVEYRNVVIHCREFGLSGGRIDCPRGELRRTSRRGERPSLPFSFSWRPQDARLEFSIRDVDAVAWSPLVKRMRGWKPEGRVDLHLVADRKRADVRFAVRDLGFSNPAGDIVGAGIALDLEAGAERTARGWNWRARLDWTKGELVHPPWMRRAGIAAKAEGSLSDEALAVNLARLDVAGIGGVTASLGWDRVRGEPTEWGFVTERLDLGTAMREWVQPWLSQLGFPEWQTGGHGLFSAEWGAGKLRRFYAGLENATLSDSTGHIELQGVNAQIPWEASGPTEASFGIESGRLGDLPLGRFSFPLHIDGSGARVGDLSAPMLDGRFVIGDLRIARKNGGWEGEFSGSIEGVSMPRLTQTLKMPVMAGTLTAQIPRIAYAGNVLALDGALAIEVFDGGITVHRLRVIDPFGAGRRFVADVTARELDLGMLTRTFSWGSIEGRFDADLRDLEMVGWKPLSFEAHIADSPGDHVRLVSLGAIQDIASLGDPAESRAAGRIPDRVGAGFRYARIGIGCTLKNGVCLLEGIRSVGEGVLLVEGAGMPSVSIIGYNRRIDWEAMVARIREVIAGKPGVVVQ